MTTETVRPPAPSGMETAAGAYFVANYPPFAYWRPERIGEAEAALDRPPAPGTPLGLYLHIPFCRKRCHFCYYKVYTDKDSLQIRRYLDAALRELELYAARPFVGGRRLNFIYFGGGTPSYLSVEQLRYLTDGMKRHCPWDEAEEVTFECEPGTLTEPKIRALRELGVTRLSLGVEHFDDGILELNGRAHRSKEIYRAWECARETGFSQINLDLIAGMVGETEEKWRYAVAEALALQPDSVTVYQMEVPYNTTIYKEMKAQGRLTAPVAGWPVKRAWVKHAFAEFEQAGYSVNSAYTVVKDPARTRFVYRERLWAGADLAALGVASFSHVGGTHFQNLHDFEPYLAALERGRLPLWRAHTPDLEERFRREWILQFKLGRVDTAYFRKKFGLDPLERFAAELRGLEAEGRLRAADGVLDLDRDGLMDVDRLVRRFFLPQHRDERPA